MSICPRRRKTSTFATAKDEALFAAVVALNFEAVVETYDPARRPSRQSRAAHH